jgi:hypothetical protein
VGREAERQALHSLIVQSAIAGKAANANAMFLLKARHGYREFDSPNSKVDVNVNANVVQPVMIVKDHGSDEEWAARVAEQQRRLMQGTAPLQLEVPQSPLQPFEDLREGNEPILLVPADQGHRYEAPAWKPRS